MKVFPLSNFRPEWLRNRFFICYLPTEIVIPCKWTGSFEQQVLNTLYAYRLPVQEFPPILVKDGAKRTKWNDFQILLEFHADYGSDGHTEYKIQNEMILIYHSELPKSYIEYRALLEEFYELNKEK